MFRFGFKNNQKEMLGLTISEIRELRAELSVLKEQLKLILPESSDKQEEEIQSGEPWDYGEAAEGEVPGLDEEYLSTGGEYPDRGLAEPLNESPEAEKDKTSQAADDTCPALAEIACGVDEDGGEGVRAGEADDGAQPGGDIAEEAPEALPLEPEKRKEWAVVDYYREKRPWWKFWDRDSHYGRSI